eukprot:UN02177
MRVFINSQYPNTRIFGGINVVSKICFSDPMVPNISSQKHVSHDQNNHSGWLMEKIHQTSVPRKSSYMNVKFSRTGL